MVISELIECMLHVKEKYGDCGVFILTKSCYEDGTVLDIRDVALSRIAFDGRTPKPVMVLSSCLFIPEDKLAKADAELISSNEKTSSEFADSTKYPQKIFISADDIIKSFFLESKNYYLDFFLIQEFHRYIMKKFRSANFNHEQILIDSDIISFTLVALSRPDIFQLVDNCIYLKHGHATTDFLADVDTYVHQLVIDFLQSKEKGG